MAKVCTKCQASESERLFHGRICEKCRHKLRYVRKTEGTAQERSGVKHDLFDTWNDDTAYAIGLLFTDGCVQKIGSSWSITFCNTSYPLVEWLSKLWKSNRKIISHTHNRVVPLHITGVTSNHMGDRLVELGVIPAKSKVLCQLPIAPEEFRIPFLRGLIDGDGSVSMHKNKGSLGGKSLSVTFVDVWNSVCLDYQKLLSDIGISSRVYKTIGKIPEVSTTGKQAEKLCSLIYSEGPSHPRKLSVWGEYKSMRRGLGGLIMERNI